MINATPIDISTLKPIGFEWADGCRVYFRELEEKERRAIVAKAEKTVFVKHQKESEVDSALFSRLYMAAVIVGWEGLKYRHLIEMCNPISVSDNLDAVIEYNSENLDFLIKNAHYGLLQFVTMAQDKIHTVRAQEQVEEMENLSKRSNGSIAPAV